MNRRRYLLERDLRAALDVPEAALPGVVTYLAREVAHLGQSPARDVTAPGGSTASRTVSGRSPRYVPGDPQPQGVRIVPPYRQPERIQSATLDAMLAGTGRSARLADPAGDEQGALFQSEPGRDSASMTVYYAGDRTLLQRTCVAIVGTREMSAEGAARARAMAADLAAAGVVVVSGLANGVDTAALNAAIEAGGPVVGVIGTPLDRATPTDNGPLQERMCREHLVLSQFENGSPVYKGNFPLRNRTMAIVSDGTLIIEASDTSGTLHQAVECTKHRRWLFISRAVVEDPKLSWPRRFEKYERTRVVASARDVLAALGR